MDKGKNPLPPRILILLDRLSNVQFSQLTRKQLKDQVEELKTALVEEFTKLKPGFERPHSSAPATHVDVPDRSRVANHPVTIPNPSRKEPYKEDKKLISKTDRKEPRKETKSLPLKNSLPAKPSYADLLKIAESVSKDPSPIRAISRERCGDTAEDRRNNGSHANKGNSHKHQSPPRGRSNDVQHRVSNRHDKSGSLKPDLNSRSNNCKSGKTTNGHRSVNEAKNDVNRGSLGDRSRNGKDQSKGDQTKNKKKEVKKSRKEEEEEMIARKKQKIKEEIERVRIRDDVLAGKRSANDLKNVVKPNVSHGNTVLSCRPASSSSQRNDSTFGRPLIRRSGDERERRPLSGKEYLDDYDDEEDEDMDSFIDDDDGREIESGSPDVSKAIRDIFGYDKRKYIGMDEDIEEASYSQIMKEEARSQRIGRQEDLADMREEMKQKRLKKERLKQLNSK